MESTATFDDVDEDEAFINELMAMHPNDDDIVVEDLEEILVEILNETDGEEIFDDGVRFTLLTCRMVLLYSLFFIFFSI